ncbi:hypothetical protein CDA63_16925 [Hymenobacter amundsenii]|uniref:Uncharacterized protein n=2 Tax=Hymenobacter amundsenii TaxID=2006685 RepID=A0A246FHA9_9BACT|nr:hypothetical protein CDA63_16925 [Hymenobacter amundsenii]
MTKHYLFVAVRFLLAFLTLTACEKNDPEGCAPYVAPVPADTYVFPVVPGTPAWATFQTGAEMVAACQVPAATLPRLSTAGLVTTCLNYPLLGNMLASNSLQRGARSVLSSFNGFGELQQRPQAAALLLERYQRMRPACLAGKTQDVELGAYSFTFSYVEMIIAQEEYLAQLTAPQRLALLREAIAKYNEKLPHEADVYGLFGLKTSLFVTARIMLREQYPPFVAAVAANPDLAAFVTDVQLQGGPQTLSLVLEYAKQFN